MPTHGKLITGSPLTAPERSDLRRMESEIEVAADTIWVNLWNIRDARLYREHYTTFEEYCDDRWGYDKRTVNRKIKQEQGKIKVGQICPKTTPASHFEIYASVPDEKIEEVAERVATKTDGKRPTAADVKAAKQEVCGPKPRKNGHPKTKKADKKQGRTKSSYRQAAADLVRQVGPLIKALDALNDQIDKPAPNMAAAFEGHSQLLNALDQIAKGKP